MSFYEIDSVEVKNPELIHFLKLMQTISLDKSIFIVGEDGTGRSVLAQSILKTLTSRGGLFEYKKNVLDVKEINGIGVYTLTADVWKKVIFKLPADSYFFIHMPTLAERKMDLPSLARFSVKVLGLMYAKPQIVLTGKALEKILQYSWPGQFIELEAVLENAVSKNCTGFIEPEDLVINHFETELEMPVGLKLEDLERKYILQTLYFVHQNRTKAADILGISIRTLRNKINHYRQEGYL